MNNRVSIPEGMEDQVHRTMYKLLYKNIQAIKSYMHNQNYDTKKNLLRWVTDGESFLKNPLIELPEINIEDAGV